MQCRGFTLIELMVVLVLIGVIASLAVLSFGGTRDPRMETEARRLAAVMELAMQTAILQNRELGLVLDQSGYRFSHLEEDTWLPVQASADRTLRARELPDGMRLEWSTDGLPGRAAPDSDKDDHRPAVLLLSSGEQTPFRVTLGWRDRHQTEAWQLEGTLTGELRLRQREE